MATADQATGTTGAFERAFVGADAGILRVLLVDGREVRLMVTSAFLAWEGLEILVATTASSVLGASGLWPALVDPPQLENALLNLCIRAHASPGHRRPEEAGRHRFRRDRRPRTTILVEP